MPNSFNVYSSTNYGYAIVNFFWLALVGILVKLFLTRSSTDRFSSVSITLFSIVTLYIIL